ncbi:MAG: GNAT family N-acetyltransferase [Patescibacteria group bacterium]
MKIVKAKKEYAKKIWEIRNHPLVRMSSGNTEVISLEDHIPWFEKKYFSDQDNFCFVLENENREVISYCRFDFDNENDSYITSIAIELDYHGQGLGHKLLSGAFEKFEIKKMITAEIKKDNIVSVKLFEKNENRFL